MTAPITTHGNRRPWEHRPSDHLAGSRPWIHGPLQPLETPRRSLMARLLGRKDG